MSIHGNIVQVDCEWVWVEVDKMVMMTSSGMDGYGYTHMYNFSQT